MLKQLAEEYELRICEAIKLQKSLDQSCIPLGVFGGEANEGESLLEILNISKEFSQAIHFTQKCKQHLTVFGSSRYKPNNPHYQYAYKFIADFSSLYKAIMTGAGGGIMEAANKAAQATGMTSYGCNIKLPLEQNRNPYIDKCLEVNYFFIRKIVLLKNASAILVFPGGFGTLDELCETLTLMQTEKIKHIPIVLVGKNFWRPMIKLLDHFIAEKTIYASDTELFLVTDEIAEAKEFVIKFGDKN